MKFSELSINKEILRAVEDMGFEEATPIQSKSIATILEGKDIIGQAQTGTGKTAAFGIPALQSIDPANRNVQAIILCPTRELAIQVSDEIRRLSKYLSSIKVLPIYGGQEIVRQIKALKSGVQIVVATPGRMMDHMRRKTLRFDHVKMVILDEADEMLNMGFREDIEVILKSVPTQRQTILFSATMPAAIMDIAKTYQKDSIVIKVVKKELTVKNIEQSYFTVRPSDKVEILSRLMDIYNPRISVVFCNTKRQVDELVNQLQGRGYQAEGLHGDMKQQQRDRVMLNCRRGTTRMLVATDVAARGIDLEHVDAVFNYDLPQDEEYYVHRIGRTGRAGNKGFSFSFVSGRERYKLKEIERYCKTTIPMRPIPTLKDVANQKVDALMAEIQEIVKDQKLTSLVQKAEEYTSSTDLTAMDLAAALLYKFTLSNNEEIDETVKTNKSRYNRDDMVRLFINVGKKQKVRSKDILGAITGEANVSGSLIGNIDVFDGYSFVNVPENIADTVIKSMKSAKIKGKTIDIEVANSKRRKQGSDKKYSRSDKQHNSTSNRGRGEIKTKRVRIKQPGL